MEKYVELAIALAEKGVHVYFTGTEKEGREFRDVLPRHPHIYDTTGQMTLEQLICLISRADALVACSTGPLHIAGYLGIRAVGFFSPRRPIHPGRWKALGSDVHILMEDEHCKACQQKKDCDCIMNISVDAVIREIA